MGCVLTYCKVPACKGHIDFLTHGIQIGYLNNIILTRREVKNSKGYVECLTFTIHDVLHLPYMIVSIGNGNYLHCVRSLSSIVEFVEYGVGYKLCSYDLFLAGCIALQEMGADLVPSVLFKGQPIKDTISYKGGFL